MIEVIFASIVLLAGICFGVIWNSMLASARKNTGLEITVPPGAILLLPPGQTITTLNATGGTVGMREDNGDLPPDVKQFLERQKTVSAGAAREKSSPSDQPPASA